MRKYLTKIEVKKYTNLDDGYGGNDIIVMSLGESWASIKTLPRQKLSDYGLDEAKTAIQIKLRFREDLNYEGEGVFFTYKGIDYHPSSITVTDLENREVIIIAVK